MKPRIYIVFCLLFLDLTGFAQDYAGPFRIWRLTGFSGQAVLRGNYRESSSRISEYSSNHKDTYFNGILQLRTRSFFVHPNFMQVTLNGIYNPQARRDIYVGVPDYTEKVNGEGLDFSALFFKKRQINLTTTANLNTSVQNIENITRIKTNTRQYGAILNYANHFLPMSTSYNQIKSKQRTIGSNRVFTSDQGLFQANVNKSFTEFDSHQLTYNHNETKSEQTDTNSIVVEDLKTRNTVDLFELNNDIAFDKKRNYRFNSTLSNSNEHGTYNFRRLQANEGLAFNLPKRVVFNANYIFGDTKQDKYKIRYQSGQASLSHRLYENLDSKLFYVHNETKQPLYIDQRNTFGLELLYQKKIPTGKLTLGYSYSRQYQSVKTETTNLQVIFEEYTLADNQTTLLRRQNVNIESIVVRNSTGTLIYQLNVDYLLIDRNPYIEIVRIPGGLIPNNSSVFIDYVVTQGGNFKYYMNFNAYTANVMLFHNLLNVYYRLQTQNYKNDKAPENQILNYYTRHIGGVRVAYSFIKAGAEYEYYNSNLLPYFGMKYFLNLQKSIKKLTYSFNANYSDFLMTSENTRRRDMDLSTKLAYSINANVKVDFDYMYRKMMGRGIDFDLHTAKLEVTSNFQRLYVSGGLNLYLNKNVNSRTLYRGVFVQLTRNF